VGRDQGLTFQALQALRDVIEQYPDSEYARSAILKFDLAFDHLGGKEMEIGRYYLKRGNYTAAINRFRVVVEQFQTTTHTPEALLPAGRELPRPGPDRRGADGGRSSATTSSRPWYEDAFRAADGAGPPARGAQRRAGCRPSIARRVRGEWL
jgi:outer membrane protein assembly factor BamD